MKAEIAYFLLTFTSLFTIINPFSSMPMFLDITEYINKKDTRRFARNANFTAFLAMIIFALSGAFLFSLFNISLHGLKLVGGILFFMMGYDLLQGKRARTKKTIAVDDTRTIFESAIAPFGIPMICGPGALTVTAVLLQDATTYTQKGLLALSILAACIANYFILIYSRQILKFLGSSGNKVFFRLMGLILMMIAIEYFFSGLKYYVRDILSPYIKS